MQKEDHFSWWMPTYVTLLIMGLSILAMFSIIESKAIMGRACDCLGGIIVQFPDVR